MNFKNIRNIKKVVSGGQIKELEEAMKYARANKRYNTILTSVLRETTKLLNSKGIHNVTFEFEGKKHTSSCDELLKELESMAKQGYA